jgi:glutamate-1-semialdehyde 2,1-aminomutase
MPAMPTMPTSPRPRSGVDRDRVRMLKDAEDARFAAAHPRSAALLARAREVMPNGVPMSWHVGSYHHAPMFVAEGKGARFTDVDGHEYHDFNLADMSMFCGYAPEPLVRAVSDRMARGNQFLLPGEDAIVVSEELRARFGLPKWQYTSSATHANTEALRVARVVSGREKVILFDGKYLGHFDETLVELDDDGRVVIEERGVPAKTVDGTVIVPFNDPAALARALERRDIAIVLTEAAITNNIGLLLPDDGFHAELRRLTRETGTLLAIDETHTQVVGAGGLVRQWGLAPDIVTMGKSIAGGLPFGAWGMTDEVAEVLVQRKGPDGERSNLVATGGTIFGNALAMAAARAVLTEILVPEAYAHTARLGERLAHGMRASVEAHRLPWHVHHLGPRSGYTFQPVAIRSGAEGRACADELLTRLVRVWLANRGVWEAIVGAGPVCSVPSQREDVDAYLAGWDQLLDALTA